MRTRKIESPEEIRMRMLDRARKLGERTADHAEDIPALGSFFEDEQLSPSPMTFKMKTLWFLNLIYCSFNIYHRYNQLLTADFSEKAHCPLIFKLLGWNAFKIRCRNVGNPVSYCGWILVFTKRKELEGEILCTYLYGGDNSYINAYDKSVKAHDLIVRVFQS